MSMTHKAYGFDDEEWSSLLAFDVNDALLQDSAEPLLPFIEDHSHLLKWLWTEPQPPDLSASARNGSASGR